ncbi:hypothetical protein Syun_031115 [Stephania yunnanensis]|uniref:Uncharacterized protein n=1 Tax=Stephania yunnanensis TaxID=152371 RepID=A0AAP0DUM1_9MAGN
MFGTALNYICLRMLGQDLDGGEDNVCARARKWIQDNGGVTCIPSWGKTWLSAMSRLAHARQTRLLMGQAQGVPVRGSLTVQMGDLYSIEGISTHRVKAWMWDVPVTGSLTVQMGDLYSIEGSSTHRVRAWVFQRGGLDVQVTGDLHKVHCEGEDKLARQRENLAISGFWWTRKDVCELIVGWCTLEGSQHSACRGSCMRKGKLYVARMRQHVRAWAMSRLGARLGGAQRRLGTNLGTGTGAPWRRHVQT